MPLKVIDRGYKALIRAIGGFAPYELTVGIHAPDGTREHVEPGTKMIDVAAANEFGLGVPRRSFIRAWADENKAKNQEAIKRSLQAVYKGKFPKRVAVERLGQFFVGQIQTRIARGIPPPNAPLTIAIKGSSKPLIDTGQLRSSVSYAIDGKLHPSKATVKAKKVAQRERAKRRRALKRAVKKAVKRSLKGLQRTPKKIERAITKAIKNVKKRARQTKRAARAKGRKP